LRLILNHAGEGNEDFVVGGRKKGVSGADYAHGFSRGGGEGVEKKCGMMK